MTCVAYTRNMNSFKTQPWLLNSLFHHKKSSLYDYSVLYYSFITEVYRFCYFVFAFFIVKS